MSDAARKLLDQLPGLKEDELRALAICSNCRQPIGHAGPMFWKLTAEQYGVDLNAVKRQDGLGAFLGGHALLARVMGPNEDMAKRITGPITLSICHQCAMASLEQGIACLALSIAEEEAKDGNVEEPGQV